MLICSVIVIQLNRKSAVGWRSIMISQPARLSCEHQALTIEQQETVRVPFEDIAVIILDHRKIILTHPVLSTCAELGICLFSTGQNHLPNGVFLSFLQHSRNSKYINLQQNINKNLVKRAWKTIIQTKISNQFQCLLLAKIPPQKTTDLLPTLAKKVRSGDSDNLEAQAAARYFPALFGLNFKRQNQDFINSALNYGYAILRGTIARSIVAHGLFPAFGLFHHNQQNAFNLADDLIEPYRPQVDLWVATNLAQLIATKLTPEHKAGLVSLLHTDIQMPEGKMTVLAAIEQTVMSLIHYLETAGRMPLKLPRLICLSQHNHE